MTIGRRIGSVWGKRVAVLGGLILFGIGVEIVIEHLSALLPFGEGASDTASSCYARSAEEAEEVASRASKSELLGCPARQHMPPG